jgi:TolA-binding protein
MLAEFAEEGVTVRRIIALGSVFAIFAAALWAGDGAGTDTRKAAAMRKKLKEKVTVSYKDHQLREVVDDLKDQVKGLQIEVDAKSGVNLNTKITYEGKDIPLEQVLDAICTKNSWGYYVRSNEKHTYDGRLVIKVGMERGYEEGKEPGKAATKDGGAKDKAAGKGKDKAKGKDKVAPKGKAEVKEKPEPKEKAEPKEKPEDDADRAERSAALKLRSAKGLIDDGKVERAKEVLNDLLKKYPKTKAAEKAKEMLEDLDK